jgi:hypothetical protein
MVGGMASQLHAKRMRWWNVEGGVVKQSSSALTLQVQKNVKEQILYNANFISSDCHKTSRCFSRYHERS